MGSALSGYSVLIIDDNAFVRKLARSMLRQLAVKEVHEIDNAADGLSLLEAKHVDIVLLDWVMPIVSGPEFIQMSRSNPIISGRQIPAIVIITGHAKRDVVLQAAALGASGIIAKPFSMSVLRDRMLSAVRVHQNRIDEGRSVFQSPLVIKRVLV